MGPQSQEVPRIWKHATKARAPKRSFLRPSGTGENSVSLCGHGKWNEFGNRDPRGLLGGGGRSARRKGKAFFSADARSRGVLPTCAHAIGGARADVSAAALARTAARAAPHWKLGKRARSRGLPRPRSLLANPLAQSLFAPSWPRPFSNSPLPHQAGGARKARHVTTGPASSSRSHIELELEEASPVSNRRPVAPSPTPAAARLRRAMIRRNQSS